MRQKFIFLIILIIIVLVLAFLSQQAYSRAMGKNLISAATSQASEYLSKGSNWVMSNILPKISGEVQSRGDMIKNEINQEKQKITEDIGKKIENYFSGIKNAVLNKETAQSCPATQTSGQ